MPKQQPKKEKPFSERIIQVFQDKIEILKTEFNDNYLPHDSKIRIEEKIDLLGKIVDALTY